MMQSDFRFFNLSLGSRLILAGSFFFAGVEIQIASSTFNGLLVAALGWLFLMLRSATNKPDDRGLEEWRPVPISEIDRLDDGLRQSKDLRKKTRNWAKSPALSLGILLLIAFRAVTAFANREDYWLAGLDLAFFLVPAIFFGRINVFAPPAIERKMPCFRAFLSQKLPETMAVAPYIRFDKDKSNADIPEDLRLLVELKRPPADLGRRPDPSGDKPRTVRQRTLYVRGRAQQRQLGPLVQNRGAAPDSGLPGRCERGRGLRNCGDPAGGLRHQPRRLRRTPSDLCRAPDLHRRLEESEATEPGAGPPDMSLGNESSAASPSTAA